METEDGLDGLLELNDWIQDACKDFRGSKGGETI
jgi:hypothetical protein